MLATAKGNETGDKEPRPSSCEETETRQTERSESGGDNSAGPSNNEKEETTQKSPPDTSKFVSERDCDLPIASNTQIAQLSDPTGLKESQNYVEEPVDDVSKVTGHGKAKNPFYSNNASLISLISSFWIVLNIFYGKR